MTPCLAQTVTDATSEVVIEFARAERIDGWWIWAAVLASILAALATCIFYYRRDAAELPSPVRWTLIGLRLVMILSVVFVFFNLIRRSQRRVQRVSEAVVLVDVSQSMSLPAGRSVGASSRIELARQLIDENGLVQGLRQEHRTSVYLIDDQPEPELVRTWLPESKTDAAEAMPGSLSDTTTWSLVRSAHVWARVGVVFLLIAIVSSMVSFAIGATASRSPWVGWSIATAASAMVVGTILLGSTYALRTEWTLAQLLQMAPNGNVIADVELDEDSESDDTVVPVNWNQILTAVGTQSRIGDALRTILVDHDLSTLAGIVLVTDGQNNGGVALSSALATARRGEVSVYPVGLGSSRPPTNVRVVDLEAPRRVYPGDRFAVSAVLQATGDQDLEVDVELVDALDNSETDPDSTAMGDSTSTGLTLPGGEVLDSQRVRLSPDAALSEVRFEIEPQSVGRRRLAVRIVAPPDDRNAADDIQSARYEVVARQLRALAIAGGPTREYRFIRNLLFRDASTQLDVWLQTGQPGISQDADQVLSEFPPTADDLFEYDAILMFDPDWSAIDSASLDLLDRFLTAQAGGLILVAGPVYHPRVGGNRGDSRSAQIASFFPVNLASASSLLSRGRQGGDDAWALKLTAEAQRAEFLWIDESPRESFAVWDEFEGVYDYVGVKSAKPGSKVYAYFSDPTTEVSGSLPVFMASQFYGAGRVFFQASGEMWRLRGTDERFFDAYYTKLVRWVSEGRLLRDSTRGVLLVDSTRAMVGQTMNVRAVLVDDQFQPLQEPSVTARVLAPDGGIKDVRLMQAADTPAGGTYTGNFVVTSAGGYEIQLTVGESVDEKVLRQNVQVRLPTSELEKPRRADDELATLAAATRGEYFPVNDIATLGVVSDSLTQTIAPQPQVTVLAGTPDASFALRRNVVLMWLMASVITFEWLVRRLHKLA
ncbi:MAG: VWA domain-containing protein [Planctomycetota bacterium]